MEILIITILLGAMTVAGTIGTFYYGRKSRDLAREKRTLTWDDVEKGAEYLAPVRDLMNPQ